MQENSEVEKQEEADARFMDLGAPKENRNFHAEKLLSVGHPTGAYHVNRDVDVDPIQRIFRITIQPHTKKQYIFWGISAVIIGVALVSFVTESALLIAAKFQGKNFLIPNSSVATTTPTIPQTSSVASEIKHLSTSTKEYSFPASAKIPTVGSLSYLVADIKTGEIIIQKNEKDTHPLASVSKLMTALVATENMDLKKYATVSRDSYNTYGAEGNLMLGEKLKLSDLMYPLLMESSNDGAEVIADEYGHPEFIQLMNKTAAVLGMKNTYYEDPSGLNPKNVSTVGDQFKLVQYIYKKYPSIFDTTLVKIFKVGNHTWTNKNAMLNIKTFIGGKNGYIDEARQTTASLYNIPMLKGGDRVIAIIELKSPDRTTDAKKLLDFVTKNVTYTPVDIQEVEGNN